ncbi:glycosyltransferase family 1 protein [Clostridium neonatale]|uniref:Glycosyltransferase family 1 protein n=1 Tax=Clostridium neonatale TaxID=137838 RepID=A0A2A7MN96_9CLOT|nr:MULTISPECIES: glycosyltransferase [Clostridium]MDU4847367.1 glycosyltransferase [Clostridium sp.]PEG28452.1 glycosyltransferase family 1 protein [Clostridium neonatale]PEG32598.1 glycosyltransferase family 1 protein [Clostridium neonatale]CAH0438861.1 Putative glycosyl transferase, group 1 family [Clostridium neonatale]
MKKILFAASTLSHIENFHIPYLKYFKDNDFEVHIMGKGNNKSPIPYVDKVIPINFEKNMFSLKNFISAFKISKLIKKEKYSTISTHTILASFFTRLGIMLSLKKHPLVINTVHGYLFDENSNFIKKVIMILAEKFVRPVTDTILVMNSTDYEIAKKYNLYKKNLYSINGMGINASKFPFSTEENKSYLREKYNIPKDDFLLIYVAEFSKRKNQKFLIESLKVLISEGYNNVKLLLLGDGVLLDDMKQYSKTLGIEDNIIFKGYIKEVCDYYQISDICVSSSRIEGLPFNIMEAMSTGLPVIASKIKGHIDLVNPGENGFLYEYNNINEFCNHVRVLYNDRNLLNNMKISSHDLSKNYSLESVFTEITRIMINEINDI